MKFPDTACGETQNRHRPLGSVATCVSWIVKQSLEGGGARETIIEPPGRGYSITYKL